ncbi:MAG: Xaa-Pro peptidase family protein [Acidobacteria bacterium]|nr:Xaa-Pro peptidase family protein [Acidobacteriota bacterium]
MSDETVGGELAAEADGAGEKAQSSRDAERLELLRQAAAGAGVDAVVLTPAATMTWLLGHDFEAHERLFLLIVPTADEAVAVVPALEEANFRGAAPAVGSVHLWDDADGPEKAAAAALKCLGKTSRVAVEPLSLRYMEFEHLRRELPRAKIESAEEIVSELRLKKSDEEAALMKRASKIAEAALEFTLRDVRPGRKEIEIASKLSSELLRRGGGGISFGPIVLSGPKSALPHGVPDEREMQEGEFLLIDFGTSFGGYHCDITRTFVVSGSPTDRMREVYESVLQANIRGVAASRPGVTYDYVHKNCQANLHARRFKDFMTHRTGHGLGLEIHEPPSVMAGNDDIVEQGAVFTIEPGLYLDGWGGVRIEDNIRVTEQGCELLTSSPRELRILGA